MGFGEFGGIVVALALVVSRSAANIIIKTELMMVSMPVLLKKLGDFKKLPVESGTFSLNRDKWFLAFGDGELPKNKKLVKDRVYSAGLYCFLWKGSADELYKLSTTHYVKGKVTALTDPRLKDTEILVRPDGEGETSYAYHPINWVFKEFEVDKDIYVPLYVGKSSKIFDRIAGHLRWPKISEVPPIKNEFDLLTALRPEGNTVAQFRQGFEFLMRNECCHLKRREKLLNNVCIALCPSDFTNVYDRFFDEDLLIGHLRPPFNVDSER